MRWRGWTRGAAWLLAAGGAVWVYPEQARACGGTFCDAGPTAMPVDQTGETILFVLEQDTVEAHIQIEYDPDTEAQRFAWVIPVMAVPEFSVGSQPLFDALLTATVPRYGQSTWVEPCDDAFDPCSDEPAGGGEKFDVGGAGDPGVPPPGVVEHTTVGAFEIFVIEGGSAQGVSDWLDLNGFAPDPAATPILDQYLQEGFRFVAMKLAVDAQADQVHPVVLRIPGNEPCVPIRLTRIASSDDLDLRTLFLSDRRVVPDAYRHVVLNDFTIDWANQGQNYREVVTLAVDEAGGHAFVTEYAGSSALVPAFIDAAQWDAEVFRTLTWMESLFVLQQQQMAWCQPNTVPSCQYAHPLVEGIVREAFSLSSSQEVAELITCPECFAGQIDNETWDAQWFADALKQRVVDPSLHAQDLLARWPYLTRMYTTISPHEMTIDPTFFQNGELSDEATLVRTATFGQFCDGQQTARLPDGRLLAGADSSSWPRIENMPYAERIEQFHPVGAPTVEIDRREEIDALVQQWNDQHGPPKAPFGPACDSDTGFETEFGGWDTQGSGQGDDLGVQRDHGCACSTDDRSWQSAGHWSGYLLLGLLGLRRRRL